jgi:hypothetical protein
MPQLTELEVEEVSLVDRPAIGRRFRVFKRAAPGGFWDRLIGGGEGEAPSGEEEVPEAVSVEKRAEAALEAMAQSLETLAARVEDVSKRLDDAVSESMDPGFSGPDTGRQSLDPAGEARKSMWKGVF